MTSWIPSIPVRGRRTRMPLHIGLYFVAVLLLAGCGSEPAGDEDAPLAAAAESGRSMPVEVIDVRASTFEDVVQLTGTIEAPDDATLSAESAGTLRSVAPLGSFVRAGQTVAQIDPGLAAAALRQAEATRAAAQAQLDLAEDQFRRQEPLHRDSIISPLEFESVRAQMASARAQVAQADAGIAQAREQLSRTRVVAPFSGLIERHMAERGEQVAPGMPVARMVATSRVKVTAGIPERYAGDIRTGTPVLITPQAYGLPPRRAQLTFVGQVIDDQNRTFPVEVMLDNADGQLKPQMVVRMEVTRRTLDDVLAIPLAAVVRDEAGPTVYVVYEQDGVSRAEARRVTLGTTSGDRVVVEDGLQVGDLVITRGQNTVATGDAVRITERRSTLVSSVVE